MRQSEPTDRGSNYQIRLDFVSNYLIFYRLCTGSHTGLFGVAVYSVYRSLSDLVISLGLYKRSSSMQLVSEPVLLPRDHGLENQDRPSLFC